MRNRVTLLSIAFMLLLCLAIYTWKIGNDEWDIHELDGQPRLVYVFATCTVNNDFLSPYSENVPFTPRLDEFAHSALTFERHRTEAPISGVAFASIFTGTQADHHNVFTHPKILSESNLLVGEAFSDAGFETFYWNTHRMATPDLGYAQGIVADNVYHAVPRGDVKPFQNILKRLLLDRDYKALVVTSFTVTHHPLQITYIDDFCKEYPDECNILSNLGQERFDYWVNVIRGPDAHILRLNIEHFRQKYNLSDADVAEIVGVIELLYRSNIWNLDRLFGSVLQAIDDAGLREQSIVVFTADHGEDFYRKGSPFNWIHGYSLSTDTLNVPLIIRGPGIVQGRYPGVTRSMDVFPTLAGLEGVTAESPVGIDLSPALRGESDPPTLRAFSHTAVVPKKVLEQRDAVIQEVVNYFPTADFKWSWIAVRDMDLVAKLRRSPNGQWSTSIYNVGVDPDENDDILHHDNPVHMELIDALKGYREVLLEAYEKSSDEDDDTSIDKSELERLRSLGYVE